MSKSIKILLMSVFFIGAIILAVTFGTTNEILPLGSNLPNIKYTDFIDTNFITVKNKPIMIMYFKPDCPHCEYEFEAMNKNLNDTSLADLYFITTDTSYVRNKVYKKWENLCCNPSIMFGFVENGEYKQKFGIIATPAFYFFDKSGRLADKIAGELKFEKILEEIEKSGGSKLRVSGLN